MAQRPTHFWVYSTDTRSQHTEEELTELIKSNQYNRHIPPRLVVTDQHRFRTVLGLPYGAVLDIGSQAYVEQQLANGYSPYKLTFTLGTLSLYYPRPEHSYTNKSLSEHEHHLCGSGH